MSVDGEMDDNMNRDMDEGGGRMWGWMGVAGIWVLLVCLLGSTPVTRLIR